MFSAGLAFFAMMDKSEGGMVPASFKEKFHDWKKFLVIMCAVWFAVGFVSGLLLGKQLFSAPPTESVI